MQSTGRVRNQLNQSDLSIATQRQSARHATTQLNNILERAFERPYSNKFEYGVCNDFNHGIDIGLTEVICIILGQYVRNSFSKDLNCCATCGVTKMGNCRQQYRLVQNSYIDATNAHASWVRLIVMQCVQIISSGLS